MLMPQHADTSGHVHPKLAFRVYSELQCLVPFLWRSLAAIATSHMSAMSSITQVT